jgi:hypothetical protein
VLVENKTLRRLLAKSEDAFDARSTFTRRLVDDGATIRPAEDLGDDGMVIRGVGRRSTIRRSVDMLEGAGFAFESVLQQSWVYRRNRGNECDVSFVSSVQRSHAWSVFSGYSLAEISVLSVIAMPLTLSDLTNCQHYVQNEEGNVPGAFRPAKEDPLPRKNIVFESDSVVETSTDGRVTVIGVVVSIEEATLDVAGDGTTSVDRLTGPPSINGTSSFLIMTR